MTSRDGPTMMRSVDYIANGKQPGLHIGYVMPTVSREAEIAINHQRVSLSLHTSVGREIDRVQREDNLSEKIQRL